MTGPRRLVAIGLLLAVFGVGAAACTANDNGGVIQGPTTTVPSGVTTVAP